MASAKKQTGITLTGFLFMLVIAGFFLYLGMKLFPVYSEYYAVVTAMKGVAGEPGVAQYSPQQVRDALARRFNISYVESVKPENIRFNRNNGYNLQIKYEVRRPLIYNLDYVAMFDKTVALNRQGGTD